MSIETLPTSSAPGARPAGGRQRSGAALLAVGMAVVAWSASAVAIKSTSSGGLVGSFYRLWFATAGLWLAALAIPALRRGFDRAWLRASLVGGALFGLHQIVFFNSIKLTSVANVMILTALQPVLVAAVAGPLFGEKPRLSDIMWSLLAIVGTAVVMLGASEGVGTSLWGDLLAVVNLFAFTAYFLASKRFRSRVGAPEYMVGMTTVAAIVVGAVTLASGQDLASPTRYDLLVLLLVAIVPGTLGHLVINWAHVHVSAFVISILILAVPVLSSAGAALLLDEPLTGIQIAGGAVVLASIAMVIRSTATR